MVTARRRSPACGWTSRQPRDEAAAPMTTTVVVASVALFALAGLCEIGGGYLMWKWWRDGAGWPAGLAGAVVLALYGIVPTYQPSHFGRVYAAYGGVFVALSLAWGWAVDGIRPDRF